MIRFAALALLLAACSDDPCPGYSGTCVRLLVDGDGDIDDLRLSASGAFDSKAETHSPSGPIGLPVVTRLELAGVSGVLDLEVTGLLAGEETGRGGATISLRPGEHRRLELGLQASHGEDLSQPGDLAAIDLATPGDLAIVDLAAGPCATTTNAVHFDGDATDYIYKGMLTVTDATWSAMVSGGATPTSVTIHVTPTLPAQGAFWTLIFASPTGQSLLPMPYLPAERFATASAAGLDVSGDGRGCNMVSGKFTIEQLVMSGTSLVSFTASFEQHCEGVADALRGCVHYQP